MRFRTSSGLAIGYSTRGSGEVIALLHPVGVDRTIWEPLMAALEGGYRLIAIDFRGHGESDVPAAGFTLGDLAGDVAELLDALGGDGRVVVAGCSMGGMVAQELALARPDRLKALVLANTAHTLPDQGRAMMRQRAETARRGMPALVDVTIERWFSAGFREREPAAVEAVRAQLLRDDPIVHAWSWQAISELHTAPHLAGLDLPALVVTGEADVSTPPANAKAIAEAIPGATCRIAPDAGHMLPIEQPALLAGWIDDFVSGLGMTEDMSQEVGQ